MAKSRSALLAASLIVGMPVLATACSSLPDEVSRQDLDAQSTQSPHKMKAHTSAARAIANQSRALLGFPSIP